MFYDAHLHAGMFPDIGQTLRCALSSGVMPVAVSTSLEECSLTLQALDANNLNIPVFAGIHPWYAHDHFFDESLLESLLSHECVKGIGECGLDNCIELKLDTQLELLHRHLESAVSHDLPVNLHVRGYHGELIRALKQYKGRIRGILHNFTFSKEIARAYTELGLMLSVGHHILRPSEKLSRVLKEVGAGHILLETDYDYIHTGDYDPEVIKNEYASLGMILGMRADKIELQLESNIKNIVGKIQ